MRSCLISWLVTANFLLLASGQTALSQQAETNEGHGDWMVTCADEPVAGRKCAIWQVAAAANHAPRLLHVEISFHRPFNGAELLIILPLGISLHEAPTLHIDGKWAMQAKIDYCLEDGCYARSKLSPRMLENFLHMNGAVLRLSSADGLPIELPISGIGSRAAFNSTE